MNVVKVVSGCNNYVFYVYFCFAIFHLGFGYPSGIYMWDQKLSPAKYKTGRGKFFYFLLYMLG